MGSGAVTLNIDHRANTSAHSLNLGTNGSANMNIDSDSLAHYDAEPRLQVDRVFAAAYRRLVDNSPISSSVATPDQDKTPARDEGEAASVGDRAQAQSGRREEFLLVLKFVRKEHSGPSRLVNDALGLIVSKWSLSNSIVDQNRDLEDIRLAREGFDAAWKKLNIKVLSDDESHDGMIEIKELGGAIDFPVRDDRGMLQRNLGESLDSRRNLDAGYEAEIAGHENSESGHSIRFSSDPSSDSSSCSFLNIPILIAVMILRNGHLVHIFEDYLDVYGGRDDVLNTFHGNIFDRISRPLPMDDFMPFEVGYSSSQPSSSNRLDQWLRKPAAHPLGHQCLTLGDGGTRKQRNGFVTVFSAHWFTRTHIARRWATAVYGMVMVVAPLPSDTGPPSPIEPRGLRRKKTAQLEKRKDMECEAFGYVFLSSCVILAFAPRGAYRVGRVMLFVEHGEHDWLRAHLTPFQTYVPKISLFPLTKKKKKKKKKKVQTMFQSKWHAMDIRPQKKKPDYRNEQFHKSEEGRRKTRIYSNEIASRTRREGDDFEESLDTLYSWIQNEDIALTIDIEHAKLSIAQIQYHIEGARVRLYPLWTHLWRAYVVCSALGSVMVGIFNPAKRENWYERFFDALQTLTFLWIGVFGILKLSDEDQNIIRHTVLGQKIIRGEEDLRRDIDINTFKLALINNKQKSIDWLNAEDLSFATPKCTGNVRIFGGLTALDAVKEGLLISKNVAVYLKRGVAFKVTNGHIDKRKELDAEELTMLMKSGPSYVTADPNFRIS